jgi:hypothetical protein
MNHIQKKSKAFFLLSNYIHIQERTGHIPRWEKSHGAFETFYRRKTVQSASLSRLRRLFLRISHKRIVGSFHFFSKYPSSKNYVKNSKKYIKKLKNYTKFAVNPLKHKKISKISFKVNQKTRILELFFNFSYKVK